MQPADWSLKPGAHQLSTDQGDLNPELQQQQPSLHPVRKQGTAVATEQEKLVLNCLLLGSPPDDVNNSLSECGSCQPWGDVLGTEWVTTCGQTDQSGVTAHQQPHRLYVQTSPGEMRLATVMTADT